MALQPKFILAPSLEMLFRDKDTGEPLSGGTVEFFKDSDRVTQKPVFQLSGTEPNYTYIALPNPVVLSSIGSFQDGIGNDILPYYLPEDENGDIELYYVVVKSAGGVNQFTREAWPNTQEGSSLVDDAVNFIPNGQFLLHHDLAATETLVAGEIREDVTTISQGGMFFDRSPGATSKDLVLFTNFGSDITNPTGSPRFAMRAECQLVDAGVTSKDLRIRFRDVNKFSTTSDTQYTLSFSGKSNTGGGAALEAFLIKNFGTGGDPSTSVSIGNFSVTTGYTIFNLVFSFGDNLGKTIGSDNDDYLELAIRFPVASLFDISFTNFILTLNAVEIENFPPTPDAEFIDKSMGGWLPVPAYNGANLYLPIIAGPEGFLYDLSGIGQVFMTVQDTAGPGYLQCDGTKYITSQQSADGVPFSRLQSILFLTSIRGPMFGTGLDYMTFAYQGSGNEFRVVNNTKGLTSFAVDGVVPTGFTFGNTHAGNATYDVDSFFIDTIPYQLRVRNLNKGLPATVPSAETSGFFVGIIDDRHGGNDSAQTFSITPIPAVGLEGKYFFFTSMSSGGADQDWYVWFQVNAVGVDPAIGGRTGIKVNFTTGDTELEVTNKIIEALNGFQTSTITPVAAAALVGGEFWTAQTTADNYYIWYTVDGVGTDPNVINKVGIKVELVAADTLVDVGQKTQTSINGYSFAVPDLRGRYIRGWDNGSNQDPYTSGRSSFVPGVFGDNIGTFALDYLRQHDHTLGTNSQQVLDVAGLNLLPYPQMGVGGPLGPPPLPIDALSDRRIVSLTGSEQVSVNNIALNYIIKY